MGCQAKTNRMIGTLASSPLLLLQREALSAEEHRKPAADGKKELRDSNNEEDSS